MIGFQPSRPWQLMNVSNSALVMSPIHLQQLSVTLNCLWINVIQSMFVTKLHCVHSSWNKSLYVKVNMQPLYKQRLLSVRLLLFWQPRSSVTCYPLPGADWAAQDRRREHAEESDLTPQCNYMNKKREERSECHRSLKCKAIPAGLVYW